LSFDILDKNMYIKTSDNKIIKTIVSKINTPKFNSHKGQNGRVLVIGGSSLFHSASLWAAEVASHFVDIVHYSSTKENEEVFLSLKKKFRNGIIVPQKHLTDYVREDDAVLVGPGMVRARSLTFNVKPRTRTSSVQGRRSTFSDILKITNEAEYTYFLTKYLIENFPNKKFVFDAGALQMMDKDWLRNLKTPAIITPHQGEFEDLFKMPIKDKKLEEKVKIVQETAEKYKTVILLKAVVDIISDGRKNYVVEGGNAGLTKGGTGDVLAGLALSFYAKNEPLLSAVLASSVLKKAADGLFLKKGYWYNIFDLIEKIPEVLI